KLGGKYGVGRIDQIENRLVGIKSREIYEAPAAVILHLAHRALEDMVLSKETLRLKAKVAQEYADLVYNGLWFTAHHQDLAAYVRSTQRFVSGEIRVRLHRGAATIAGRRSPHSLYSPGPFEAALDPRIGDVTATLELDKRLAAHDVRGSIAHAHMLGSQRVIAKDEAATLVKELEPIAAEIAAGTFSWPADAEDVHSAV